jgi:hypothetical protein
MTYHHAHRRQCMAYAFYIQLEMSESNESRSTNMNMTKTTQNNNVVTSQVIAVSKHMLITYSEHNNTGKQLLLPISYNSYSNKTNTTHVSQPNIMYSSLNLTLITAQIVHIHHRRSYHKRYTPFRP